MKKFWIANPNDYFIGERLTKTDRRDRFPAVILPSGRKVTAIQTTCLGCPADCENGRCYSHPSLQEGEEIHPDWDVFSI